MPLMTDFKQLEPSRHYVAQNSALPVDDEIAIEITEDLISCMCAASPATMNAAAADFLAGYAWNSKYTEAEGHAMLDGILAEARRIMEDYFRSEREGVFVRDRKTEPANENVQPL